jgi:hypothetical protein
MSIGDFPMRRIRERGPLGRLRFVVTILTGKYKSKLNVFSLSLGQGLPSRLPSRAGGAKLLAFVP